MDFPDCYSAGDKVVILECDFKMLEQPEYTIREHYGEVEKTTATGVDVLLEGRATTRYHIIRGPGKCYSYMEDGMDAGPFHILTVSHYRDKLKDARKAMFLHIEALRDVHEKARQDLRDKLGLLDPLALPASMNDIRMATALTVCSTIHPATNICITLADGLPDTPKTTKFLMDEIAHRLVSQGFAAMAERFWAALEDIDSLYALIILGATYVSFELDQSRFVDPEELESVGEPEFIQLIRNNGMTAYVFRQTAHAERDDAISACVKATGHRPIFVHATTENETTYSVESHNFSSPSRAMTFARYLGKIDKLFEDEACDQLGGSHEKG